MYTFEIQSFKILASFCGWAGWFELTWSKIPKDKFSHDVAQLYYSFICCHSLYYYIYLFLSSLAGVDPGNVQTLYTNPYTIEIDYTTLTHQCIQPDGSVSDCTGAIANASYAGGTCSNTVKEVNYFIWVTTRQNMSSGVSHQARYKPVCAATEAS